MKALVIEDDAVARMVLKRLLTRFFPHNVLEAVDGEAGWTMIEQQHPAVIFCDMHMPKLDGLGVLRRLRAHPELKETALIAITSVQEPEFVRQLIELGVADYLLKPIALEGTVKRLAALLPALLAAAKRREEQAAAAAAAAKYAAELTAAAKPPAVVTAPQPEPAATAAEPAPAEAAEPA